MLSKRKHVEEPLRHNQRRVRTNEPDAHEERLPVGVFRKALNVLDSPVSVQFVGRLVSVMLRIDSQ